MQIGNRIQHRITDVIVLVINILLVVLPANDCDKISDKTRNFAFDNSVVADYDVFFLWTWLVKLIGNWNLIYKSDFFLKYRIKFIGFFYFCRWN